MRTPSNLKSTVINAIALFSERYTELFNQFLYMLENDINTELIEEELELIQLSIKRSIIRNEIIKY